MAHEEMYMNGKWMNSLLTKYKLTFTSNTEIHCNDQLNQRYKEIKLNPK